MKKLFLLDLFISIITGAVLFLGLTSIAEAYTWQTYNGHEYAVTNTWESWVAAESEAVAQGGHLVTINDAAENYWVAETFKDIYVDGYGVGSDATAVYIGYYLINPTNNEWGWISGETSTYTNLWPYGWDGTSGPHAYLHTNNHPNLGTWNHAAWHTEPPPQNPFYGYMKGVIERPTTSVPEPATLDDAVMILQVISGLPPSKSVNNAPDVNSDGKIGLVEVIYILQKLGGVR